MSLRTLVSSTILTFSLLLAPSFAFAKTTVFKNGTVRTTDSHMTKYTKRQGGKTTTSYQLRDSRGRFGKAHTMGPIQLAGFR